MAYLMGIDQGGSKTAAIIGDEHGHILGMGKSFGAVHSVNGMDKALLAARQAFEQALAQAELSFTDIYGIYGGVSGLDWDYEKALVTDAVKEEFGVSNISIVNDCLIAMRAATNNEKCAAICAGSGVNCAVRNGKDQILFGYYIPDDLQGGSSIGMKAVQRVFDSYAGVVEETLLTSYLLEIFQVSSVDELLQKKVNGGIHASDYLKLPIVVEKAALEGDLTAKRIYQEFAQGIVPYIISGMRKMDILNEKVDVVLSGSIFKCKEPVLRRTVESELKAKAARVNIIDAVYEPIVGAYLSGLDEYWGKTPEDVYSVLKEEQVKFNILRNWEEEIC